MYLSVKLIKFVNCCCDSYSLSEKPSYDKALSAFFLLKISVRNRTVKKDFNDKKIEIALISSNGGSIFTQAENKLAIFTNCRWDLYQIY